MSMNCMVCRERAVSSTTLASYATEMEHDGRKYAISVPDFHVLKCQHCGEIFLDQAANERLSDAVIVMCEIERVAALDAKEIAVDAALITIVAANDLHPGIGTADT